MKLLLIAEARKLLKLSEMKLKSLLQSGMPYLQIGSEYRFIESEIVTWHKINCPTQEELEKRFVDHLGRTIDQYVKIEEISSFLRMEKTKVYKLCQSGMPSQLVGRRRFFNFDDIISFFRKGEIITHPPHQPKKQRPALFVVDGSHSPTKKQSGAGVLLKNKDGVTGYSFGHGDHTNIHAEMIAIGHAMRLAKENNFEYSIIATDQLHFVNAINKIHYVNRLLSGIPSSIKKGITDLISELKEKVQFVYYKSIKNQHGFTDMLYHNAHALSRRYADSVVEGEKLDKRHLSDCVVISNKVSTEISIEDENTVKIEFDKVIGEYAYFNVFANGKTKCIRSNTGVNVKAALEIANQMIESAKQQVKLSIKKIPTFADDMKVLFNPARQTIPNKIRKLFENLKEKTTLIMEDHLEPYIAEYMQQRAVS